MNSQLLSCGYIASTPHPT